ncbi:hypothetical protein BC826DRAFT_1061288 [Russula brevipes]|nr:hypothetical protein BC826DRAFT_1061288 [Russula brevipes]
MLVAPDGVQLGAGVDRVGAPLLWTSSELLAGRWLWHDLTMLAGADPASLRGAGRAGAGQMTMMPVMTTMMTESAARHVLAAVTQRARKLFVLMGRRQLDALANAGGSSAGGGGGGGRGVVKPTTPAAAGEVAIPYDATIISPARLQCIANHRVLILVHQGRELAVAVAVGARAVVECRVVADAPDELIP